MHLARGRKSLASVIIASYQVDQGVVTIIDAVAATVRIGPVDFTPFADIINVINSNIGILTDIISLDLLYFSDKFIESGFVTQSSKTEIFSKAGISDRGKASQLLDAVIINYRITPRKQEWVDKFVAVFSSQPAYEGLADTLTGEMDPPGIV